MVRINKAEDKKELKLDIDDEIVITTVNMGIDFNNTLIEKLFLLKEYNENFNANTYLVDVIQKNGPEDPLFDRVKKIQNVPKLTGLLNSTIDFMKN